MRSLSSSGGVTVVARESGGIGRRAGFRILWGNPWEFKSPLSHPTRCWARKNYPISPSIDRGLATSTDVRARALSVR